MSVGKPAGEAVGHDVVFAVDDCRRLEGPLKVMVERGFPPVCDPCSPGGIVEIIVISVDVTQFRVEFRIHAQFQLLGVQSEKDHDFGLNGNVREIFFRFLCNELMPVEQSPLTVLFKEYAHSRLCHGALGGRIEIGKGEAAAPIEFRNGFELVLQVSGKTLLGGFFLRVSSGIVRLVGQTKTEDRVAERHLTKPGEQGVEVVRNHLPGFRMHDFISGKAADAGRLRMTVIPPFRSVMRGEKQHGAKIFLLCDRHNLCNIPLEALVIRSGKFRLFARGREKCTRADFQMNHVGSHIGKVLHFFPDGSAVSIAAEIHLPLFQFAAVGAHDRGGPVVEHALP